ncbi:hypothetical protein L950_0213820 [Sphingobacterium sp. IITKGP-BTPF85]|nr:hypothetical protein L950_0213820 [Sphingobacterium sp. IITKGP-BTPF85]
MEIEALWETGNQRNELAVIGYRSKRMIILVHFIGEYIYQLTRNK